MAILLSRLKEACHDWRKFPPLTAGVGGLLLVVLALAAQSYASYIRWLEYEKRDKWRAETALDFATCGRRQVAFRPIVWREHGVTLSLRAPLEGELAAYAGKDQSLSAEAARHFLAGREFTLSWQITQEEEPVAHGTFHSSDLDVWAMKDHVLCRPRHWGGARLQAGQEYRLTAQVEQANPAVNELSPLLEVRTWGSLKGRLLAGWRWRDTWLFCAVGSVFLVMAHVRHVYDRRPSPQA